MKWIFLFLVAALRWVPHPWNVTPIGAVGLFAGAHCDRRVAWLMPLIPLAIGDALMGGYHPLVMVFVYAGFALSAVFGRLFLAEKRSALRFGGAITVNAIVFYLLSNFPVWLVYYPNTLAGLVECYAMGLPFLWKMMVGDALFVTLIFGGHWLATRFLAPQGLRA